MKPNEWHKSSYSGASSSCVEVAETTEHACIRDTKHREQGHLEFTAAEWRAFLVDLTRDKL